MGAGRGEVHRRARERQGKAGAPVGGWGCPVGGAGACTVRHYIFRRVNMYHYLSTYLPPSLPAPLPPGKPTHPPTHPLYLRDRASSPLDDESSARATLSPHGTCRETQRRARGGAERARARTHTHTHTGGVNGLPWKHHLFPCTNSNKQDIYTSFLQARDH